MSIFSQMSNYLACPKRQFTGRPAQKAEPFGRIACLQLLLYMCTAAASVHVFTLCQFVVHILAYLLLTHPAAEPN